MLALLAAAALAAPDPLPEDAHWARFSRIPALARTANPGVVVRVGTLFGRGPGPYDYWFERQIVLLGRRQSVSWTSTQGCPAARAQLARLSTLAPRYPALGEENDVDVVADGTTYTLQAPTAAGNGTMRIETMTRGPIEAWVDAMLTALEPCWTASRPALSRQR